MGRVSAPLPFGMWTRRTGGARYVPDFARFEQRPEVVLQMRRVLLRGLSVHARRAVLARAPVRLAQPVDVDVVRERRERHVGRFPRQLRYPFEFR